MFTLVLILYLIVISYIIKNNIKNYITFNGRRRAYFSQTAKVRPYTDNNNINNNNNNTSTYIIVIYVYHLQNKRAESDNFEYNIDSRYKRSTN